MRVGFCSYPMLFQRSGGLQVQIQSTRRALEDIGIEARLFDMINDDFAKFDIIHVFCLAHANYAIVETARQKTVPVVISPVIHPPFSKWQRLLADLCDRVTGRLTNWTVQTTYGLNRGALHSADLVVTLGKEEQRIVIEGYGVARQKVAIVPNGISRGFFLAEPSLFVDKFGIGNDFILNVASISEYKNQLGMIAAAMPLDCDVVLIGPCSADNEPYLARCKSLVGSRVHYLGPMYPDAPLLPAAYAAAKVFVLVSQTECAPISVLEALAAGTPAVLTRNNSLDLPSGAALVRTVSPRNRLEIRRAISLLLQDSPSGSVCSEAVSAYSWENTAKALKKLYSRIEAEGISAPFS